MSKAKVFMSGGSQAVRLPAEFRFDTREVDVRRDPLTGEIVLSKPLATWDDYFAFVRSLDLPADAFPAREQPTDEFLDPFAIRAAPATTRTKPSRKTANT